MSCSQFDTNLTQIPGLVKLAVMINVFFYNQQHEVKFKRLQVKFLQEQRKSTFLFITKTKFSVKV